MKMFKLKETTKVRTKKSRPTVSWEHFERVLSEAMTLLGANQTQTMLAAGFSSSVASSWHKEGKAPVYAYNALRGLIADHTEVAGPAPVMVKQFQFSYDDLIQLLTAVARAQPNSGALLAIIANEIAHYDEG